MNKWRRLIGALYTAFGQVVEGMDCVNQIARGDVIEHIDINEAE